LRLYDGSGSGTFSQALLSERRDGGALQCRQGELPEIRRKQPDALQFLSGRSLRGHHFRRVAVERFGDGVALCRRTVLKYCPIKSVIRSAARTARHLLDS
jgi:hypothetical protein